MGGVETDYERLSMGVPTRDELINAMRIPEVEKNTTGWEDLLKRKTTTMVEDPKYL